MRDYQKEGFQWLKTLGSYRFGGILADDMGLGKTLQSIAYLLSEARGQAARKPALIVAPASLVYNWEQEFRRFAPSLKVEVALGARKERSEMLLRMADSETDAQEGGEEAAGESDADVIITSYPSLRKDIRIYREMAFSTLILDEAQAIKNASTQTAQAVREITAGCRFALTGTPIENSVDELWSIFDAVFPGLFSGLKNFRGLSRDRIARMVRPFILRRLRAEVLEELPERIETVRHSELSRDQKKLYAAYLEEFKEETIRDLEFEGFQRSRMKILAKHHPAPPAVLPPGAVRRRLRGGIREIAAAARGGAGLPGKRQAHPHFLPVYEHAAHHPQRTRKAWHSRILPGRPNAYQRAGGHLQPL